MKQNWYFQLKSLDLVKIICKNESDAKKEMNARYGREWFVWYTEKEFKKIKHLFPKEELIVIDLTEEL